MRTGQVVLLNFPFSDLTEAKYRPAVVLAVGSFGDLVVCLVTSQPVGKAIELDDVSFMNGGLVKASRVVPDRIFTASQKLVGKVVGKLTKQKLDEIRDAVIAVIRGE